MECCWEDETAVPDKPFDPTQYWTPVKIKIRYYDDLLKFDLYFFKEIIIENAVANTKQTIKYKVEKRGEKIVVIEQRFVQSVFVSIYFLVYFFFT